MRWDPCFAISYKAGHNAQPATGWSVSPTRYTPIGTLIVNATACLAIGLVSGYFAGPQLIREEYRLGLTIGVLGGIFDVFHARNGIVQPGQRRATSAWLCSTWCWRAARSGFTAVWIGYRVAERCFGV